MPAPRVSQHAQFSTGPSGHPSRMTGGPLAFCVASVAFRWPGCSLQDGRIALAHRPAAHHLDLQPQQHLMLGGQQLQDPAVRAE